MKKMIPFILFPILIFLAVNSLISARVETPIATSQPQNSYILEHPNESDLDIISAIRFPVEYSHNSNGIVLYVPFAKDRTSANYEYWLYSFFIPSKQQHTNLIGWQSNHNLVLPVNVSPGRSVRGSIRANDMFFYYDYNSGLLSDVIDSINIFHSLESKLFIEDYESISDVVGCQSSVFYGRVHGPPFLSYVDLNSKEHILYEVHQDIPKMDTRVSHSRKPRISVWPLKSSLQISFTSLTWDAIKPIVVFVYDFTDGSVSVSNTFEIILQEYDILWPNDPVTNYREYYYGSKYPTDGVVGGLSEAYALNDSILLLCFIRHVVVIDTNLKEAKVLPWSLLLGKHLNDWIHNQSYLTYAFDGEMLYVAAFIERKDSKNEIFVNVINTSGLP